jgi:hypothetical protein
VPPHPAGDPAPRPGPAAGTGEAAGAPSGFADLYAYEAPVYAPAGPAPTLPIDLDGVSIHDVLAERYALDAAAGEKLSANGFVVTASPSTGTDQFPDFYRWANQQELPIFVTVDTALHLYHLVFDALLMTLEEQHLTGDLRHMITRLRDRAAAAADGDGPVAEAARGNLAFCDVILKLLDPDHRVDSHVADVVSAEIALIEARGGFQPSPVFGYEEDYTQYIPRGHYTRTPGLSRYFKAMMWLGRMSFLFKAYGDPAPEGILQPEAARDLSRRAALLTAWLHEPDGDGEPAVVLWKRVYRVTAFFAGFSDDLTPAEAQPIVDDILAAADGFDALADPGRIDVLRARLAALRSPRIYSGTGGGAITADLAPGGDPAALLAGIAATVGMRFMGQRYTPDADVMGRLVFPTVGSPTGARDPAPFTLVMTQQGPTRGFSRGLDVMDLLGAPRARAILDDLGDAAYQGFDDAVAAAATAFPPRDDPAWHQNLYWSWLEVLAEYVAPRPVPTQPFERSDAWLDRTMTAALASWAQLRHDTILYVKQPYTIMTTSAYREPAPPPPPKGFVEPHPEVFARLIALNDMTLRGLEQMEILPSQAESALADFGDLLGTLRDLAIKEIEDRPIDAADNDFLSTFGTRCGALLDRIAALNVPPPDPNGYGERGTSAVDTSSILVADVMTNPEAGEVLEEATGRLEALTVVMRAPGRGDLMAAVGPVLSYYEFRWPMTDRLTDETWREIVTRPDAPAQPSWVCAYRIPCPPRAR